MTLPAHHNPEEGTLTSCWELTPEEIELLREVGRIYLRQWTGNQPMQPVLLFTKNPFE